MQTYLHHNDQNSSKAADLGLISSPTPKIINDIASVFADIFNCNANANML